MFIKRARYSSVGWCALPILTCLLTGKTRADRKDTSLESVWLAGGASSLTLNKAKRRRGVPLAAEDNLAIVKGERAPKAAEPIQAGQLVRKPVKVARK